MAIKSEIPENIYNMFLDRNDFYSSFCSVVAVCYCVKKNVDLSMHMPTENFEDRSVIVHGNFQGKLKSLKQEHLQRTFSRFIYYTIVCTLKNCPEMEIG